MHPLESYLNQIVWGLVGAFPWLLGISVGVALLSWSPLGRLLVQYLKDRRQNDQLLEANNAELAEVSRALNAMVERLDATERTISRLSRDTADSRLARPDPGLIASEPTTPTPH